MEIRQFAFELVETRQIVANNCTFSRISQFSKKRKWKCPSSELLLHLETPEVG